MAKPAEPEAEVMEVGEPEELKPAKAAKGPACPHCGSTLREEHDEGDHLHCDNAKCIGCCYERGADGPLLRAGYKPCPAAG